MNDQKIMELLAQYVHGSDHPDQVGYRDQVKERGSHELNSYLPRLKMLAKLGGFDGKRILDVGCGFGWDAFVFSLMGNSVVGIDILPGMIEGMTESIATMRKKGVRFDLTGICGDICDPKLAPNSFDAIYSIEAIEHVHDLNAMAARCRELLKPRGKLLLVNDNNVINRETRAEITSMWEQREHSWDWVAKLKKWRPVEHANAKPFAVMREEIARAANPSLSDTALGIIVERTAGLLKPQIEDIARRYNNGFRFPEVDQYDRCRNPDTGEYAERLLDPYKLVAILRNNGFKASVRHFFRRFPFNLMNSVKIRPINNYLFNVRPIFIVAGERL